MGKYFAMKTLNCQKFNIVSDIWDRGVITEIKPVVYGLNSDVFELFFNCVHLGYIKISRISGHFGLCQVLFITDDTFVTPGISKTPNHELMLIHMTFYSQVLW